MEQQVELLISYGGKLLQRHHDKVLFYTGGKTEILVLDRSIKYFDIVTTVVFSCNLNNPYELKYSSPDNKDLNNMVSLDNDQDVENMMKEYDRVNLSTTTEPKRMRLFVLEPTPKSQRVPLPRSDSQNPDYLFGFDKEYDPNATPEKLDLPEFPDKRDFGLYQENQKEQQVENQKEKQIKKKKQLTTEETSQGITNTKPCDNNVTNGPINFAYTTYVPASTQLIYWIPIPIPTVVLCGDMQRVGPVISNNEQPVYIVMPPLFPIVVDAGLHV